jgi:hypothetical protein
MNDKGTNCGMCFLCYKWEDAEAAEALRLALKAKCLKCSGM